MACNDCTKLLPLKKSDENNCKNTKKKVEEVRLYCPENLTETISESSPTGCATGYISNLINVDPILYPEPFVSVDVNNPDDFEEANEYAFDRTESEGDDQYNLGPLKVYILDPDQQCTVDSWKGQDVGIMFKIENKSGEFIWRRFLGKLTALTGGLLGGYELTFNADNPGESEKPLWVSIGTADATTTALDALTNFG